MNKGYRFFKFRAGEVVTIEAVKRQYHKLAMQHHPDLGGDLKTMQQINAEFDQLRKRYYNVHESTSGATYRDDTQDAPDSTTEHFEAIIEQLLHMDGVGVELCGSFLWLDGNTYQYRTEIKALGFRWASKKKRWFLAPSSWEKKGPEWSMERIRSKHGSKVIRTGGAPTKRALAS